MATTITSVKLPEHQYPHVEVNINDNTIRTYVNRAAEYCRTLCVFMAPKGPDGLRTVTGGLTEFEKLYGNGAVADYGQAFLNARQLAQTNACTVNCLRITAPDAKISNIHIFLRYKVTRATKGPDGNIVPGKMEVRYVKHFDDALTDINNLCADAKYDNELVTSEADGDDTWNQIRILSVASLGKGQSGNRLGVRLTTDTRSDRSNSYKNYTFTVFDGGAESEIFKVCFNEDAVISGKSYYIDNVVNDDDYTGGGSQLIKIDYNENALATLYNLYTEVNPETTLTIDTFDPFLGIDKKKATTKYYGSKITVEPSIDYYEFKEYTDEEQSKEYTSTTIGTLYPMQIDALTGTSLGAGDDGAFAKSNKYRRYAIEKAFREVFGGKYDNVTDSDGNVLDINGNKLNVKTDEHDNPLFNEDGTPVYDGTPAQVFKGYPYEVILSKNRCPIDFFLDANYDYDTKMAICDWAGRVRKEDFEVYLDNGTSENMVTKADAYQPRVDYDYVSTHWTFAIDAYFGKIKDPYNYRIVEVTSTYNLARKLPLHWKSYDGKHIPYAGSAYGVIDSYLPNSVFPLMDESLDSEHMDACVERHINYAQINSKGDVIRGTQTTRYPTLDSALTVSNLSEINNCHVVLDIKKDVEKALENFAYNFNEASDLIRFNSRAEVITQKYAAAQVKRISATFDRTDEEAEYGILHLYIEVVHKALVKIAIVDIDVNRNVNT